MASGIAESGTQLIAARAAQGLSAALLTPSALSLITTTYSGHQQKAALALWGAVGSLGVAAGVLVGGAITTWTSWQFIFWVNAPVGMVAFVVGRRSSPRSPPPSRALGLRHPRGAHRDRRPEHPRLRPRRYGDTRLVVGLDGVGLAASLVLLLSFLKLERRAAKPLLPPHVWKLTRSCPARP